MINDRQITISAAGSRKATQWPPQTLHWSEFVQRLQTPARGTETLAEYLRLKKSQQDDLKDVGGFVAGTLAGNRRKANAVTGRDIITLDMDNIPPGGTQDVLRRVEGLGCAYAVYSTRKHEPGRPRLRILLVTDRTVTADEYEPIARKLADLIGIEMCDPTTFEASRLMYWPSCCSNSEYIYYYGDKPFLSADGILDMYQDWRNVAEWPIVPGEEKKSRKLVDRQEDPTAKPGVVGAFCRVYDVYKSMETFLPGIYEPVSNSPGRYTYTGGSTVGGAIIYDEGLFLYSHHATDPVSGQLVNAFDLVRHHRFAELDDDTKPGTPVNRMPSYTAMCELAVADSPVATLLNQERYEKAVQKFADSSGADPDGPGNDMDWMEKLQMSSTGALAKTTNNILIILKNDPLLKDRLVFDEFANRALVLGDLPWDKGEERRQWTDVDDAGLRHYIEKIYNITGKERIFDALTICTYKNRINDVKDYLTNLKWDGMHRLDTLLTDYLGAEDNVYTRAVIRKSLVAAVARIMVPGVKYDYMPIFIGPQGIGKSTFLQKLGKHWFSDSLQTFEGKEAAEMIQGVWINELGELNGLSRSETNSVKQFLSRREDIFREPYGRRTNAYPRRCVFFGTTNDSEFLKDRTGNRRFWPIEMWTQKPIKDIHSQLEDEVDQIWAEAFVYWQLGEPLYLSGRVKKISEQEQEAHMVSNAKEGVIREFVEKPLPVNWYKRSLPERHMYWSGEFGKNRAEKTIPRDKICAAEVWCECFNKDISFMRRRDVIEINEILNSIQGWKRDKNARQFGKPYGRQRGYSRQISLTQTPDTTDTLTHTSNLQMAHCDTFDTLNVSALKPRQ